MGNVQRERVTLGSLEALNLVTIGAYIGWNWHLQEVRSIGYKDWMLWHFEESLDTPRIILTKKRVHSTAIHFHLEYIRATWIDPVSAECFQPIRREKLSPSLPHIASLLTGVRNWERTSGIRKRLVQSNDAEKKTLAGREACRDRKDRWKGSMKHSIGMWNTRRRLPVWRCPWDLRCAVQKDKVHQQEQIDPATTTMRCAQLTHCYIEVTLLAFL